MVIVKPVVVLIYGIFNYLALDLFELDNRQLNTYIIQYIYKELPNCQKNLESYKLEAWVTSS